MQPAQAAPPIGMAEFLSAVVASLFLVLAGAALLAALTGGRASAAGAAAARGAEISPVDSSRCANAPRDPLAMRLGRARVYPAPVDISLEPAPYSVEPVIAGPEAYARSGERLSGCDTEEVLAFYTSRSPAIQHVLAWVLVSSIDCPAPDLVAPATGGPMRQCVSISPIDASTGATLGTRMFLLGNGS
jgi:hypothetical protein